jgi:hypothetical protein
MLKMTRLPPSWQSLGGFVEVTVDSGEDLSGVVSDGRVEGLVEDISQVIIRDGGRAICI